MRSRALMRVCRRPASFALLCFTLMSAGDARSFAADPPPQRVATAPAAKKAGPPRAQPAAKRGSLLGAIVNALGADDLAAEKRREAAQKQQEAMMDQNVRNLEAQFRPQFQQLLYAELAYLRQSCKPDAKPFVEVAKAAKAELHVPLRQYIRAEYMPQIGMGRFGGQAEATTDDPRLAIQKLLKPLAEAKLGPEKARLYRQECDKREEARKHAVIVNLVAALDERLVLTAPQRDKLVESLSAKYEHSWEQYCQMFAFNGQYMPSIPDQSIVPLLNEKQKIVWQDMSRLNGRVRFGFSFNNGFQFGEAAEIQEIARLVEEVKDGP